MGRPRFLRRVRQLARQGAAEALRRTSLDYALGHGLNPGTPELKEYDRELNRIADRIEKTRKPKGVGDG